MGTGTSISPVPNITTTYYVRAEGSCLFGPGRYESITVQVKTLPAISLQTTKAVFCTNKDTVATLTGLPAGGVYSGPGVTGNSFNASKVNPGTHKLYYTYSEVGTGCTGKDSVTITVNNCLGINPNNANLVRLYPNPASSQVIIENEYDNMEMELYNPMGQQVMHRLFSGNMQLDISQLTPGVYLCKIWREGEVQTIRVVKE